MPLFTRSTRQIGQAFEQQAYQYLKRHGLTLVCRNYHCRQGEIDLIMVDQDTLVFIEVRYRQASSHGTAVETVDHHKQEKLRTTAQHFLLHNPQYQHWNCRFDVIGLNKYQTETQIHWVPHAFME